MRERLIRWLYRHGMVFRASSLVKPGTSVPLDEKGTRLFRAVVEHKGYDDAQG